MQTLREFFVSLQNEHYGVMENGECAHRFRDYTVLYHPHESVPVWYDVTLCKDCFYSFTDRLKTVSCDNLAVFHRTNIMSEYQPKKLHNIFKSENSLEQYLQSTQPHKLVYRNIQSIKKFDPLNHAYFRWKNFPPWIKDSNYRFRCNYAHHVYTFDILVCEKFLIENWSDNAFEDDDIIISLASTHPDINWNEFITPTDDMEHVPWSQ